MTDDIVERLRERAFAWNVRYRPSLDMEAADEIERLRADLAGVDRIIMRFNQRQASEPARRWKRGDRVRKKTGAQWQGRVVGFYETALTPIGYAIESEFHENSVQIFPEAALEDVPG